MEIYSQYWASIRGKKNIHLSWDFTLNGTLNQDFSVHTCMHECFTLMLKKIFHSLFIITAGGTQLPIQVNAILGV